MTTGRAPLSAEEWRRQRIKDGMRKLAMQGADMVTLLAWRMTEPGLPNVVSETLAMVRDQPYAIIIVEMADGTRARATTEHDTPEQAEEALMREMSGSSVLLLPPTEFLVPRPPYVDVNTVDFGAWELAEVHTRVSVEIARRTHGYGSTTFMFGEPEPAFVREAR